MTVKNRAVSDRERRATSIREREDRMTVNEKEVLSSTCTRVPFFRHSTKAMGLDKKHQYEEVTLCTALTVPDVTSPRCQRVPPLGAAARLISKQVMKRSLPRRGRDIHDE